MSADHRVTDGAEGIDFYATRGATVLDAFSAYMSTGVIPELLFKQYARVAQAIDAKDDSAIARALRDIVDMRVYRFDDEAGEYVEIPDGLEHTGDNEDGKGN